MSKQSPWRPSPPSQQGGLGQTSAPSDPSPAPWQTALERLLRKGFPGGKNFLGYSKTWVEFNPEDCWELGSLVGRVMSSPQSHPEGK